MTSASINDIKRQYRGVIIGSTAQSNEKAWRIKWRKTMFWRIKHQKYDGAYNNRGKRKHQRNESGIEKKTKIWQKRGKRNGAWR